MWVSEVLIRTRVGLDVAEGSCFISARWVVIVGCGGEDGPAMEGFEIREARVKDVFVRGVVVVGDVGWRGVTESYDGGW